jgi:hypothetical protein
VSNDTNLDPRSRRPDTASGFWAIIVPQFQGAFSDNALQWLVISLIAGMDFSSEKRDQLAASRQNAMVSATTSSLL